MYLQGKIALVPGASRPIGRAIATNFGEQGARLLLPVFDWPESITEMESDFTAKKMHYDVFHLDLRDPELVDKFRHDVEGLGINHVDFLINNIERGGMPVVHGAYDLPENREQWDIEIDTSLKAKWLLYSRFRHLLENSAAGAVVNISSIAAMAGRSGVGASFFADAYSAANRAISSFTETWAREMAPKVRVNELMIGLVDGRHGQWTKGWSVLGQEEQQEILSHILLERTGLPEEVARSVYFLAVEAQYMTGSVVRMDGGFCLAANKNRPMPKGVL